MKAHVSRYTPEVVSDHRHAEDKFLQGLRLIAGDAQPGQAHDVDVRTGLDAAFEGLAEHPHRR